MTPLFLAFVRTKGAIPFLILLAVISCFIWIAPVIFFYLGLSLGQRFMHQRVRREQPIRKSYGPDQSSVRSRFRNPLNRFKRDEDEVGTCV